MNFNILSIYFIDDDARIEHFAFIGLLVGFFIGIVILLGTYAVRK